MATARELIIRSFAEETKKPSPPDFREIGSRSPDLDVSIDGRLNDDDEITLETYKKMRKDPQVKACLLVLKLPILQTDWQVNADSDEAKKLARFTEARIRDMDDSLTYYLREILTALEFGRSITENVWQLKTVQPDPEEDRMDQLIVPLKLKTYDPESLTIKLDPDTNRLEGVYQKQKKGQDILIPADKLLIYSHEKEFGDYNGQSALRAAYKPWIIKEFLQRMWNIALERYGTPFMSMNMPQGGSLKKALELMDLVKKKTGIPLPDGYELEVHALANAGMSFKEAIEYQDTMIARAMLIPDLIFGNSQTGAFALSKTHAGFFLMRLNAIAQEISDIMTKYLVKPLIRYNFGEVREFPEFKLTDVAEEDKQQLLNIVKDLITGKVIAPSEDWIRERLGLPQANEEAQEYLDKQREVVMSGLENIKKAQDGKMQKQEDLNNVKTDPKQADKQDPKATDPEEDKKKQKQIQKNAEIDYYTDSLRNSVRKLLDLQEA